MSMMDVFQRLKDWGPVLFALGFLAPLIAQSLERAEVSVVAGFSELQFGLMIALPLGLVAKLRGRWV